MAMRCFQTKLGTGRYVGYGKNLVNSLLRLDDVITFTSYSSNGSLSFAFTELFLRRTLFSLPLMQSYHEYEMSIPVRHRSRFLQCYSQG